MELIDFLEAEVVKSGEFNILIGEDFSLYIDPHLDRSGNPTGRSSRGQQYKKRMLALLENRNLMDIW